MQMRMSDGSPSPPSPESQDALNPAAKRNAEHNVIGLEARALKTSVTFTKLQSQHPAHHPLPAPSSCVPLSNTPMPRAAPAATKHTLSLSFLQNEEPSVEPLCWEALGGALIRTPALLNRQSSHLTDDKIKAQTCPETYQDALTVSISQARPERPKEMDSKPRRV